MPSYVTPPKIVALASGTDPTALWAACEDNSIWRLFLTIDTDANTAPMGDPGEQWQWEKMPAIPFA